MRVYIHPSSLSTDSGMYAIVSLRIDNTARYAKRNSTPARLPRLNITHIRKRQQQQRNRAFIW
ncbi:hypothetical protein [Spirosoma oryzae]|nr:hypothetical protein [Spirosoma oryzae]